MLNILNKHLNCPSAQFLELKEVSLRRILPTMIIQSKKKKLTSALHIE